MTHTEYIELTELLRKLTGDADLLRDGRFYVSVDDHGELRISGIDQAGQHATSIKNEILTRTENNVARAVEIMNGCVDEWTASNQARADNKLPVTADDRALFEAMSGFMSATEKAIKGVGRQYIPLRSRCRSWMDQATGWFPELYPAHVQKLLTSKEYDLAVGDGLITPPLTLKKNIADLARFLVNYFFTLSPKDYDAGNDNGRNDWQKWDRVFMKEDGTPITAKQLKGAYNH